MKTLTPQKELSDIFSSMNSLNRVGKEKYSVDNLNNFLDKFNEFNKYIDSGIATLKSFGDFLDDNFEEVKDVIYSKRFELLQKVKEFKEMYNVFAGHPLNKDNFKSKLEELALLNDTLEETINDAIFFFEAKNNEKFTAIFSKIANV